MTNKKRLVDANFAQHIANVELSPDDAGTVQWVLSHTPTVDAEQVVYGRWKGAGMGDYLCSACWEVCSGGDRFKYCPHCGAKMDGGN